MNWNEEKGDKKRIANVMKHKEDRKYTIMKKKRKANEGKENKNFVFFWKKSYKEKKVKFTQLVSQERWEGSEWMAH